jgi:hypothetical protein
MTQPVSTYRKSSDKEANAMASNDLEVLDPAVPVESVVESKSGHELDRRHFFTALGVAGVAAGAALLSKSAEAQQPSPNGYAQVDVINFLLNIKYLKATLYSYITQGADLPGSSYVTVGTGEIYNQPAKITFTTQQITDIFNEMYYDELNQLIALRAQQGVAVGPRPTMNILGTGPSGTAPSSATTTLTQAQAIALARLLEDVSASAFAGATTYLTGTNLQLAAQSLASDGQHAGLIRLIAIQNAVEYQGTQYASVSTSNTAQAALTFTGQTIAGTNLISATLGTTAPSVGSIVNAIGVPPGAGAVITNVSNVSTTTFTAIPDKTNILKNVSSVAGLVINQTVTGTYIPAGSYITAIGTNTVTISANTTAAYTVAPTGFVTAGSPTVTGVSSVSGLIVGQGITGTGIPSGTTITAFTSSAPLTITLSANATTTSVASATGTVTLGSPTITNLSTVSGFIIGQAIFGTGIPTGTTITAIPTSTTLTMSANATATSSGSSATFSGIVTSGSAAITLASSTAGLSVGQLLAGTGIPVGATIKTISGTTVTSSANATASSTFSPSAVVTTGSNVVTSVGSVTGLIVGQPITGTGIPASTTITAIGTNTITMSNAATQSIPSGGTITSPILEPVLAGGQALTSPATEAVTSPSTDTYTVTKSQITIAGNATATGFSTFYVIVPDNQDVEPFDQATAVPAANPANGPSSVAGASPTVYQGFFNTAGAGTSSSTSTPAGFAFARTFQQVLAILYGYNSTNNIISTQNYEGGFFPYGVTGSINSTI